MRVDAVAAARYMARALRLAERGINTTHPNPRVGCVIVRDGVVIGEGAHLRAGEPHAEVHALRQAGERARGAELFVTLEPCSHVGRTPPCADALIAAGLRKVWVAMVDPNPKVAGAGIARLRAAGIEVETGLLEAPAQMLNRGFVSRMTRARPWLSLKLAASVDARTAMASGESQWITSAASRRDVHRQRAAAGAVLSSSATVMADDPQLNVRGYSPQSAECVVAVHGESAHLDPSPATPSMASPAGGNSAIQGTVPHLRQPDRIVLDSDARVPATARVWAAGARRLWLTAVEPAQVPEGVELLLVPRAAGGLDLPAALQRLAAASVNELWVECGAQLAGALLQQRLVDELIVYLAPRLLGHAARPLVMLPGLEQLAQSLDFKFGETRAVGSDLRLQLLPIH